jgi:hypothetical protein
MHKRAAGGPRVFSRTSLLAPATAPAAAPEEKKGAKTNERHSKLKKPKANFCD